MKNGGDLATPFKPEEKQGMDWTALAAMMATESEGVTKNLIEEEKNKLLFASSNQTRNGIEHQSYQFYLLPRTMFLSASPSAAAPNSGGLLSGVLPNPIRATNSFAYVRLGSGCPPPKSSCLHNNFLFKKKQKIKIHYERNKTLGTQFNNELSFAPSSSTNIRLA